MRCCLVRMFPVLVAFGRVLISYVFVCVCLWFNCVVLYGVFFCVFCVCVFWPMCVCVVCM